MMAVLSLLPVGAFVLAVVSLGNARPAWGWGRALVRGVIYFGSYAVLGTELLSLLHALTALGLVILWGSPVVGLSLWLRGRRRSPGLRLPRVPRLSLPEWIMVAVIVTVLALTALVAFLAPPNTWDSLTYHMARVAHWAQSASLEHYATGIERQNLMPPGAEIGMLHAYVLGGGDRLVNFVQWGAMAASVLVAAALAGLLGASRSGKLLAAAFVATLPMGIAEATSTMTDYVVAMWIACVAYESLSIYLDRSENRPNLVALGLATGLAILAKPTAFAYLLPFGLLVAFVIARRRGLLVLVTSAATVALLVLVLNAGYFGRNLITYGNPIANPGKLEIHSNEGLDAKVVISNLIRNASLHAGTPWPAWNALVLRGVIWTHLRLGIGLTDPRTTVHGFELGPPQTDEKRAGNPLHAALGLAALALLTVSMLRGDRKGRLALVYLGLVAATFVLLSAMIKFSTFASRYHVPFFVLLAPAVGFAIGRWKSSWPSAVLACLMLYASGPWLLHLNERPLLEDRNGYSVASSTRTDLYFMTGHPLAIPYGDIAAAIGQAECTSVGVMLSGDAAEYPFWPLLGEPRGDVRLEWIVAGTPSARYEDLGFQPCAVICDFSCPAEWTEVRGLPIRLDEMGYRLFLSPTR